jgi:hypothetical protein
VASVMGKPGWVDPGQKGAQKIFPGGPAGRPVGGGGAAARARAAQGGPGRVDPGQKGAQKFFRAALRAARSAAAARRRARAPRKDVHGQKGPFGGWSR